MGKSSRRVNRAGKSKEERKNNFKQARKNHLYNQATCKNTSKITRNVVSNEGQRRVRVAGGLATISRNLGGVATSGGGAAPRAPSSTKIPWTYNNIKKNANPLFDAIFC